MNMTMDMNMVEEDVTILCLGVYSISLDQRAMWCLNYMVTKNMLRTIKKLLSYNLIQVPWIILYYIYRPSSKHS